MGKNPYFPFFASDWLGSNRRAQMTLEEQGAYINLLARQWSDPACSLPEDDEVLAKLSEMGERWFKGGSTTVPTKGQPAGCPMVRACFPPHPNQPGRIANPKLLELRAERDEWSNKSRVGGLKSAASRRLKSYADGTSDNQDETNDGLRVVQPPLVPKVNQRSTKGQPKVNLPSPSPSPRSLNPLTPLKTRGKRAVFVPPTLEEVTTYCRERQNGIDAQTFLDHYETVGWRYGKGVGKPIKDWKAAIRTWEANRRAETAANIVKDPDAPCPGARHYGADTK